MSFLDLEVRTARIVHGFDEANREIVDCPEDSEFTRKLIAVSRIQSISEAYLLVTGSHGRMMYWEYRGSLDEVEARLAAAGLILE